ncbi:alpha/beta hydrolase [Diaminobutyricimonas sp. TR449]|uniref:alpha/beta hydrolase n=1 Tax=Diaminobutyricimonas sp. TR449 TaxID=2708076 RepID=UPI0014219707|nr:alpha/beta hydrolase [Diaminobutyricimonas sp. TR449]
MPSPLRTVSALVALTVGAILVGCTHLGTGQEQVTPDAQPIYPMLAANPGITVLEDVRYGTIDGVPVLLDVCLPPETDNAAPHPALISVHGGSWTRGDKAAPGWRAVCTWLASEGFATFSLNYRLAPKHVFPAAITDVAAAVEWMRSADQVDRFGIDPERIGAFGGSAGGNLVSLLGVTGSGSLSKGARVAAVASLSGPMDLTGAHATDSFLPVQLSYLGCIDYQACMSTEAASPQFHIDPSDPPFLIAHSTVEMIPLGQATRFVEELRAAGIDTEFVTVEGDLHALELLDESMSARVLEFFRKALVAPDAVLAEAEQPG